MSTIQQTDGVIVGSSGRAYSGIRPASLEDEEFIKYARMYNVSCLSSEWMVSALDRLDRALAKLEGDAKQAVGS